MLKANDRIKVHFYSNNLELKIRQSGTIFTVYEKHGKIGIDWNTENLAYVVDGDSFTPFETFAPSIQFENIETGKRFYFCQLTKKIQEV